jgi:hypothetical protein
MFTNPLFNTILEEIERESINKDNNVCLISRLDLYPYNCITLPCTHRYRIEYLKKLLKKKPVTCPYCSLTFDPETLVKQCSYKHKTTLVQCTKTTYCDSGVCILHGKPKCTKVLKTGNTCSKNQVKDGRCKIHLT